MKKTGITIAIIAVAFVLAAIWTSYHLEFTLTALITFLVGAATYGGSTLESKKATTPKNNTLN